MLQRQRIIGTLLPLSALNPQGFDEAQKFLVWLQKTVQSAWQLLPLHETQLEAGSHTKHVPSPYKSYGIGLDPKYINSNVVSNFEFRASNLSSDEFIKKHKDWLHDYALFCALRDYFGTDDWREWEGAIRNRETDALVEWKNKLKEKIESVISQQVRLHEDYVAFHKRAKELDIALIGDLPFYPSLRSPLVWAHQSAFDLRPDGSMSHVSGASNKATAHFGRQVWGHPLYKWHNLSEVMKLWKIRIRYLAKLYDVLRIDYATGFFEYGAKDLYDEAKDEIRIGPGLPVFAELVKYVQKEGVWIFAEDSGRNMKDLREFLHESKIPGIKIYRFAFDEKRDEVNMHYAQINEYSEAVAAYTSTHDTEPLLSYLQNLKPEQKQRLAAASEVTYASDDKIFARAIIHALVHSPARIVIIPMQDWLLTTERINIPGTEKEINDPNWQYHLNVTISELPKTF